MILSLANTTRSASLIRGMLACRCRISVVLLLVGYPAVLMLLEEVIVVKADHSRSWRFQA